MLKHIPAVNSSFNFEGVGDVIIRRGNNDCGVLRIHRDDAGQVVITIRDNDGTINRKLVKPKGFSTTSHNLRWHLYNSLNGAALYIHEEEPKKVEQVPLEGEERPNMLVMVGKGFTKLVDGLRLVMRPYVNSLNQNEYTVVVSRHRTAGHNNSEVTQVHVQLNGKPYTTFSFTQDLDNKTLNDLPFFEKHTAYVVRNYQKAEKPVETKHFNGTVVTDNDEEGQYIIWAPDSNLPPRNVNKGQKQAKAIAATMSERYGKTFFWCRLMGKVEQAKKVVTTTETKITTL